MPRAYGYLRCSFLDQEKHKTDTALSIPTQLDRVRQYFTYQQTQGGALASATWSRIGWEGVREDGKDNDSGFFVDKDVSAYKKPMLFRPAGRRLSAILESGDTVIFPRLDRAFRSVQDALSTIQIWQRRGILIHFLDPQVDLATAHGRAFFQMAAVWAEFSSALHSERLREVHATAKKVGRVMNGHKVAGWKNNAPDWEERAVMAWIVGLRDQGKSWRTISDTVEGELCRREGRKLPPRHEGEGARRFPHTRCIRLYKAAAELELKATETLEWPEAA